MTEAVPATRRESRAVVKPNNRTKAIVAIAAGAILLLGGGTTLAYWSTTQELTAGTVTSGDLNITVSPDDVVWTVTPEGGTAVAADVNTLHIVPGDTVTMTQTAELTLVGDNIKAALTAELVGATMPGGAIAPAPVVTVDTAEPVTALTDESDGGTVTVTVTYLFPTTTSARDLTNEDFDFGGVDLTLTQVAP
ncbi:alternate-type signal peptide domain-containing protein [Microbacterium sp. GXF6406]